MAHSAIDLPPGQLLAHITGAQLVRVIRPPDHSADGPLVQICSDGSTAEAHGIVGAAAVFRHSDGTRSSTACSYFGRVTGAEASEHTGLRCALILAESLDLHVPSRLRFNMDSSNGLGRYTADPPLALRQDMLYLAPLLQLNRQGLRALHDRGHTIVVQKIARNLNTDANQLAGEMMASARDGGQFVALVNPRSGAVDTALGVALSEHSVLLLARDRGGGPSRNRRSGGGGPRLEPVWPSRDRPQPAGVPVCNVRCQVCLVHNCGLPLGHSLECFPMRHECPDCQT